LIEGIKWKVKVQHFAVCHYKRHPAHDKDWCVDVKAAGVDW